MFMIFSGPHTAPLLHVHLLVRRKCLWCVAVFQHRAGELVPLRVIMAEREHAMHRGALADAIADAEFLVANSALAEDDIRKNPMQ